VFIFLNQISDHQSTAMFTFQRHSSAVKAPGKAAVLENFL